MELVLYLMETCPFTLLRRLTTAFDNAGVVMKPRFLGIAALTYVGITAVLAAGLFSSGCASTEPAIKSAVKPPTPPVIDYRAKSQLLQPKMTEQQVIGILGQPNSSDVRACGTQVGSTWQCKNWDYGIGFNGLDVQFRDDGNGNWLVDGWQLRTF